MCADYAIVPRPPAKRAAALAFINAVSNATSIYVSYLSVSHLARAKHVI